MVLVSDAAQSPGEIMRRLADLERQVRELSAARRLESAAIGAGGITVQDGGDITIEDGGGIDVQDGGVVLVRDETGKAIIWLGRVPFGDGSTRPGMVAFRTDAAGGVVAMSLFDGIFAVWDRQPTIVMSTDEASGQGIATPWLTKGPLGMSINADTFALLPGTTSGTFVSLWEGRIPLTHPRLRVYAFWSPGDASTTGEGRVLLDGVQIGSTISVDVGGDALDTTVDVPGWGTTVDYLHEAVIQVQTRRTGGTSTVKSVVYALYGVQS